MDLVKRPEFERLPRESAKAHAAFRTYLDLGAERSLAVTAARVGKSKRLMERWSRKHDWPGRVAAHAAHVADVERRAIEERAVAQAVEWDKLTEAVRREAWRKSEELLTLVEDFMARWRECQRVPGFESVVRGLELVMKLKQFAAGMPSEIKEVNTTVTGTIDLEWEVALRKGYGPLDAGNPKSEGRNPKGEVVDVQEVREDRGLRIEDGNRVLPEQGAGHEAPGKEQR